MLNELSRKMFKMFSAGWHIFLQSLAVVFHSVVNGLSGKADQIN